MLNDVNPVQVIGLLDFYNETHSIFKNLWIFLFYRNVLDASSRNTALMHVKNKIGLDTNHIAKKHTKLGANFKSLNNNSSKNKKNKKKQKEQKQEKNEEEREQKQQRKKQKQQPKKQKQKQKREQQQGTQYENVD